MLDARDATHHPPAVLAVVVVGVRAWVDGTTTEVQEVGVATIVR